MQFLSTPNAEQRGQFVSNETPLSGGPKALFIAGNQNLLHIRSSCPSSRQTQPIDQTLHYNRTLSVAVAVAVAVAAVVAVAVAVAVAVTVVAMAAADATLVPIEEGVLRHVVARPGLLPRNNRQVARRTNVRTSTVDNHSKGFRVLHCVNRMLYLSHSRRSCAGQVHPVNLTSFPVPNINLLA